MRIQGQVKLPGVHHVPLVFAEQHGGFCELSQESARQSSSVERDMRFEGKRKIALKTALRSRIPSESSQDFPRFCLFKIPSQTLRRWGGQGCMWPQCSVSALYGVADDWGE